MAKETGIDEIEIAKNYLNSLISSHEQELLEIQENFGANNIKDFFYSDHRGTWIIQFNNDLKDSEFETKEEMMDWIKTEGND